ncbi:hypothetical protein [Clostridium botulinum]|uniref:hypothetical protein n=1 Tax=Clostridium botulinum TaxID=1491 RepID=UPI0007743AAC|nr:hypothetical protein [Clostridium botulinum]AUN03580.1 chemotaxis protein [Clostridium botulinum]MBN3399125.1 chemotaxis protein [Clostridium botulinum]MBN3412548.1 chemotaxis protein [Clostridium botulinum]
MQGVEETSSIAEEVTASAEEQFNMTKKVSDLSNGLNDVSADIKESVNKFKI